MWFTECHSLDSVFASVAVFRWTMGKCIVWSQVSEEVLHQASQGLHHCIPSYIWLGSMGRGRGRGVGTIWSVHKGDNAFMCDQ